MAPQPRFFRGLMVATVLSLCIWTVLLWAFVLLGRWVV